MRTFIQLRDGIGYATLITPDNEPDHTVTPDDTTAIEVFTDNPDQFLKMKYNEETKTWSESPLIYWAVLNQQGRIIEVCRTYFLHEVNGPILPEDGETDWCYSEGQWVKPVLQTPFGVIDSFQSNNNETSQIENESRPLSIEGQDLENS